MCGEEGSDRWGVLLSLFNFIAILLAFVKSKLDNPKQFKNI